MVAPAEKKHNPEKILEAAIRVFGRRGYTGTSLNEVAAEAGVTKPTLYNHFENKAALYESMLRLAQERAGEVLEQATLSEESIPGKIKALVRVMIQFGRENGELSKVLQSVMFAPDEVRRRSANLLAEVSQYGVVRRLVEQGVAEGDLEGDPMDIALVISGTFGAMNLMQSLFPEMPVLQPGIDERLLRVILNGAKCRKP